MRAALCKALLERAADPSFVFLTGDVGFGALEPLRDAMGDRFINAGIAEQNMISVAAGLARQGFRPWVYSIAPFIYARPFEQIRNDLCLHRLPVVLVGNGGGYGYGVMGASHHAIEDYGALTCLSGLRAYVPAFDSDISDVVQTLFRAEAPSYLRLGVGEWPDAFPPPPQPAWRCLLSGTPIVGIVLVLGTLAGKMLERLRVLEANRRPSLWVSGELPLPEMPCELVREIREADYLVAVEEHVARGGFGEALARELLLMGVVPRRFVHRCATGYPSGRYGSQQFHREECGIDAASIAAIFESRCP